MTSKAESRRSMNPSSKRPSRKGSELANGGSGFRKKELADRFKLLPGVTQGSQLASPTHSPNRSGKVSWRDLKSKNEKNNFLGVSPKRSKRALPKLSRVKSGKSSLAASGIRSKKIISRGSPSNSGAMSPVGSRKGSRYNSAKRSRKGCKTIYFLTEIY